MKFDNMRGRTIRPRFFVACSMDTKDLIAFLGGLPTTADTIEWKERLGEGLKRLFPDVDHVVVAVPMTADLTGERVPTPTKQQVFAHVEPRSARKAHVLRHARREEGGMWERIYRQGADKGFPLRDFGAPVGIDIEADGRYCGSILLLRRAAFGPISSRTGDGLRDLLPILRHAFRHHLAIVRATWPTDSLFVDALRRVGQETALTRREEEALLLLMMGRSYEQAADTLGIAVDSFRKAVTRLYGKLGVDNVKEIFSRYMGIEHHQIER